MAQWHGLAKLRMHNDLTLKIMDAVTVSLGDKLRTFSDKICPAFVTRELRREWDARMRRQTKKSSTSRQVNVHNAQDMASQLSPTPKTVPASFATQQQQSSGQINNTLRAPANAQSSDTGRHLKSFNLSTYKLHSLGDYVATIKKYGTTDSYSTELV